MFICCAVTIVMQMGSQQGLVFSSTSTLAVEDKTRVARKHTFRPVQSSHLKEKLPALVCRPNQNEKPGWEPSLFFCLAELIITWKYLGHEEDSNRFRVKRARLLYGDYSSKFDSCSQLQEKAAFEFKPLPICQRRAFCHPSRTSYAQTHARTEIAFAIK